MNGPKDIKVAGDFFVQAVKYARGGSVEFFGVVYKERYKNFIYLYNPNERERMIAGVFAILGIHRLRSHG